MDKQIYQMTLQEYIQSMKGKKIEHSYFNRLGQLQYNHKNEIEWALQLGKIVEISIIQTYPDLIRKYVAKYE